MASRPVSYMYPCCLTIAVAGMILKPKAPCPLPDFQLHFTSLPHLISRHGYSGVCHPAVLVKVPQMFVLTAPATLEVCACVLGETLCFPPVSPGSSLRAWECDRRGSVKRSRITKKPVCGPRENLAYSFACWAGFAFVPHPEYIGHYMLAGKEFLLHYPS